MLLEPELPSELGLPALLLPAEEVLPAFDVPPSPGVPSASPQPVTATKIQPTTAPIRNEHFIRRFAFRNLKSTIVTDAHSAIHVNLVRNVV
jgi:hypothetical protein